MKTATRPYLILAILLSTTICQACQGQYRAEDDSVTEKIYFVIGILFVIACFVAICWAIPSLENFHQGCLVSIVLIIYYLPQFLLYELLLLGRNYYRQFIDKREDPKDETEREDPKEETEITNNKTQLEPEEVDLSQDSSGKRAILLLNNPTETWKQATVEENAEVENGTTNQSEKITKERSTLEAKSNVSGDVELPTSDPNELKIERELEQEPSKINKQSICAKEDPRAGKQRVREVFHMDVAELIIVKRDA